MDGKELLRRMIDFDRWANAKTYDSIVPVAGEAKQAVTVLAHIYLGWDAWMDRMEKLDRKVDWFPKVSMDECGEIGGRGQRRWDDFLASYQGDWAGKEFETKLLDGRTGAFSLTDIVLQLVSHGAHHRGQVNTMVRQAGGTPPYTTFMGYVPAGQG